MAAVQLDMEAPEGQRICGDDARRQAARRIEPVSDIMDCLNVLDQGNGLYDGAAAGQLRQQIIAGKGRAFGRELLIRSILLARNRHCLLELSLDRISLSEQLSDTLAATGTPPICRQMTFDVGPFALRGAIPDANEGMGGFCPRRTVLDSLLANAAAEAGVEVREGFTVEKLLMTGDIVVGVRGHGREGRPVEERARLVIGADGVNSFVARSVRAQEYDVRPVAACGYYSYFSSVRQDDIELYVRDHHAFGGAPTHDGLHLVMVNWPASDFHSVRADIEGHVWRALAAAPDFAARMRAGRREETWYGTAGVPGYFRKPYGQGWALVGDASYNRDPITAQGISDAFIEAEMLASALTTAWSGVGRFEDELAAHEAARNERVRPMYEFTSQLATLEPPPPEMRALFDALQGNQDATNAFLSAITGAIPLTDFMSTENLGRIMAAAKNTKAHKSLSSKS